MNFSKILGVGEGTTIEFKESMKSKAIKPYLHFLTQMVGYYSVVFLIMGILLVLIVQMSLSGILLLK